jgi:NAD(P)H-dependent nitrite reductase small subunit
MAIEYIRVAQVRELSEHRGKLVRIEDEDVALFKVDGAVYALSNVCAHQHFSALHQGEVKGLRVSCPMHGWTYSLITGVAETGNGKVKAYPVRVEGEHVFVGVEQGGEK